MVYSVTQTQFQSKRSVCHYGEICDDTSVECSWVYDCGKKAFVKKIPNNRDLDFIFVSHFDADHVNGIADLPIGKDTRIYIPYIPASVFVITLLRNIYSFSGLLFMRRVYTEMIKEWREKGDETFVSQDDTLLFETMMNEGKVLIVEEGQSVTDVSQNIPWEFFAATYIDPYILVHINNLYQQIVSANGMSFQNAIKQRLNAQRKNYFIGLKGLYRGLYCNGTKADVNNIISMNVYAGPTDVCLDNHLKKSGWLHTGDSCFHLPCILDYFLKMFRNYESRVAVLSLPHHGSKITNTARVIKELLCNFSKAQLVIPYSNAVKKCCHFVGVHYCMKSLYCTNHNDICFEDGKMQCIGHSLFCNNKLCRIY